jgi:hypothetical protein
MQFGRRVNQFKKMVDDGNLTYFIKESPPPARRKSRRRRLYLLLHHRLVPPPPVGLAGVRGVGNLI